MFKPEDIIPSSRRCPKCYKPTLIFEPTTNTIRCSNCGFEKKLQQT